jgi:hypothetical protein
MMSDAEYAKLKREYRSTQDFTLVMPVIELVVKRSTRPGRIPGALSPTGSWNPDSRAEAAQAWIEARLLRRPDLAAAFDFATKPGPFLSSLERSFRHFLMNAEPATEVQNLVEKAGEIMREGEGVFTHWPLSGGSWWGLRLWRDRWGDSPDVWSKGDDRLVSLAWACGSFVITRYGPKVSRTSPVLERDELRRFLQKLLELADRAVDNNQLRSVFERRFSAGTGFKTSELFDDAAIDGSTVDAALEEQEVEACAELLLEEISAQQAEVVRRKHAGEILDQIAEEIGLSRGTVDNELVRVGEAARRLAGGYSESRVLEKLFDLLSKQET